LDLCTLLERRAMVQMNQRWFIWSVQTNQSALDARHVTSKNGAGSSWYKACVERLETQGSNET
jgi:hypothetical protein